MTNPRIVIYQSPEDLQWYWHLQSANGRILAQGEGHTRKADALRAAETVVDMMLRVEIVEK